MPRALKNKTESTKKTRKSTNSRVSEVLNLHLTKKFYNENKLRNLKESPKSFKNLSSEIDTAKNKVSIVIQLPTKLQANENQLISITRQELSQFDWKTYRATELNLVLDESSFSKLEILAIRELIELKSYIFESYKNSTAKYEQIKTITLNGIPFTKNLSSQIIESIKLTRNIINKNSSEVHAAYFEAYAKSLAKKSSNISIKVIDHKDAKKLGMGCLLAVGAESIKNSPKEYHPRIIVLEYKPDLKTKSSKKPISSADHVCLVGKGLTYDTGGLCLKPPKYMIDMRSDMGGAAAVLGVFDILAKANKKDLPKTKVTGIMAMAENAFGASSYKPGDVLTAMNKKTVQVVDTDAEGRLVLADALSYASLKVKPDSIIDMATLTGSIVASLGEAAAGAMTNDEDFAEELIDIFNKNDEKLWLMPSFEEYETLIKSDIADFAHCNSRPDALVAYQFLSKFVKDGIKYIHLDIAGKAWYEDENLFCYHGGSGFAVKSLYMYLKSL